jgi:hypothetical protein
VLRRKERKKERERERDREEMMFLLCSREELWRRSRTEEKEMKPSLL